MSKTDWRHSYHGHRDVPHQPERRGTRFLSMFNKLVYNGTWTRQRARQAARAAAKERRLITGYGRAW